MKLLSAACLAALISTAALAQQGGGVVYVPPITATHCAEWKSANVLEDSGGTCGGSGGSPAGNVGDIQDNAGAGAFGASALNDNGTIIKSTESIDTKTNATVWEIANASSVGTTLNKLAKLTGAPSTALITATTDVAGALGVVIGGAGTTGSAQIAITGQASCVFDGATTAGHYVINSATVAGDCSDAGAGEPNGKTVVGIVLSTNVAGGTFGLSLFPPTEASISASSGTAGKPCTSTNGSIQYDNTGLFGCAPAIVNSGVFDFTGTQFQFGGNPYFAAIGGANYNTGIGGATLPAYTSGQFNICIGYGDSGHGACNALTSGSINVAVGFDAGKVITTASNDTFIGQSSGLDTTTGTVNTAVGSFALQYNTTGAFNVAVGANAIGANSGSAGAFDHDTAIGDVALGLLNGGASFDTAIGFDACGSVTTGNSNLCLGPYAGIAASPGTNLTTGSRDIIINALGGGTTTCSPSSASVNDEFDLCSNGTGVGDVAPIERCNIASIAAGSCTFNVPLVSGGTPPTLTGTCTTATQTGGNTAGSFAASCTAQTVIMTFGSTAPHGWICVALDQTTTADTLKQSAGSASTTACTLSGTTVASDVIVFQATAF